jgi:hypothetical protein
MKCEFCNEEITHKPYSITQNILTVAEIVSIPMDFCNRTCMIASKIFSAINKRRLNNEIVSDDKKFFDEIKREVIRDTPCKLVEYVKAFAKINECCTVLDKNEIEKNL